jgi:hypothetical protein
LLYQRSLFHCHQPLVEAFLRLQKKPFVWQGAKENKALIVAANLPGSIDATTANHKKVDVIYLH